jgi:tetratricopeptide (TPR) repeat protein
LVGVLSSEAALLACTEIIMNPSFGPDEKALAYRYRGEARTNAGAVQPAIADFSESIRIKKDNTDAFAGRGRAKFTAGNRAGAIADYSEANRANRHRSPRPRSQTSRRLCSPPMN